MQQPPVREHTGDQRSRRRDSRQFADQLSLSEKHRWNESKTQRIRLSFVVFQWELKQQVNRRVDTDDSERCQRRPVAEWVIVSIGNEHVGDLPPLFVPVPMLVLARFLRRTGPPTSR